MLETCEIPHKNAITLKLDLSVKDIKPINSHRKTHEKLDKTILDDVEDIKAYKIKTK